MKDFMNAKGRLNNDKDKSLWKELLGAGIFVFIIYAYLYEVIKNV